MSRHLHTATVLHNMDRGRDALVLSHDGLVESRRSVVLPATFMAWNEIDRIDLDTVAAVPGPKYVIYHLTPESIQHRGRRRGASSFPTVLWRDTWPLLSKVGKVVL